LKGARKPVNIGTDEFVRRRGVRAGEMSGREPTFYLVYFQAKRQRAFGADSQDMAFDVEQIRATGQRVAASHGLDVVEIEFLGGAKHRILRAFIEKNAEERKKLAEQAPEAGSLEAAAAAGAGVDQLAGVTHEDCAAFSRDFGTVLDVEDLIPGGEYTLEVSSPGLDRKLKGIEDYRRFVGLLAKVQTFEPVAGNRHWQGRIIGVEEGSLRLALEGKSKKKNSELRAPSSAKAGSEQVEIALANIEKANLAPEF
jgi:ribosome maturation factor RimP